MGFSTLIDILGSTLIGSLLLMILLRLHSASASNVDQYASDLVVQQNLVSIVEVLENDFRKIGYSRDWTKIPDPTKAIIYADKHKIGFYTDIKNKGTVDQVFYIYDINNPITSSKNPNDHYLYRSVNSVMPRGVNLGVTKFELRYFDALGDTIVTPVANTGAIASIEINIRVETPWGFWVSQTDSVIQSEYPAVFWKQIRLAAKNLRNR